MSEERLTEIAERAEALGWSPRQAMTAYLHTEDSDEFRDATARAEAFNARFEATTPPHFHDHLATLDKRDVMRELSELELEVAVDFRFSGVHTLDLRTNSGTADVTTDADTMLSALRDAGLLTPHIIAVYRR